MALDRVGNVAHTVARPRLLDAQHHAFIRHIDQPPRLDRHITDEEHPAGVTVPAINNRRHVDIDDVAVAQAFVAGYAVTHDMVDRCAAAMREPAIAERSRDRPFADHMHTDHIVELARGDAGHHMRDQRIEHVSREFPRRAHARKTLGAMKLDRAITRSAAFGGSSYVSGHIIHIDQSGAKKTVCPELVEGLSFFVSLVKGKGRASTSSA